MKHKFRFVIIIIAMVCFISCSMMNQIQQRVAIKNCQFDLVNARAHSFSVMNMLVDLELQIVNPNPIRVIMDQLDLLLYINHRRTLTAAFGGAYIEPGDTQILTTTLRIPYLRVGMAIIDVLKNDEQVTYRLDGQVYLKTAWGKFRFPITIYKSQ